MTDFAKYNAKDLRSLPDTLQQGVFLSSSQVDDFAEAYKREERERIVKLLEDNHLTAASELIEQDALSKGEQDSNACEPADLPCINGFSCKKHETPFEDLMLFAKGEQK